MGIPTGSPPGVWREGGRGQSGEVASGRRTQAVCGWESVGEGRSVREGCKQWVGVGWRRGSVGRGCRQWGGWVSGRVGQWDEWGSVDPSNVGKWEKGGAMRGGWCSVRRPGEAVNHL